MSTNDNQQSEDDEAPKKKRKPVNKKQQADTPSQEKFFRGAVQSYLDSYAERKRISQKEVNTIASFIEEYLQAFIIVGYNHDGETITHVSAKNQVHTDALNTCLCRFITQKSKETGAGDEWSDGRCL